MNIHHIAIVASLAALLQVLGWSSALLRGKQLTWQQTSDQSTVQTMRHRSMALTPSLVCPKTGAVKTTRSAKAQPVGKSLLNADADMLQKFAILRHRNLTLIIVACWQSRLHMRMQEPVLCCDYVTRRSVWPRCATKHCKTLSSISFPAVIRRAVVLQSTHTPVFFLSWLTSSSMP